MTDSDEKPIPNRKASSKGSPVTVGVSAACEIYARKLLGPAFRMKGYETLPVPQSGNGPKLWNFMVTARHKENDALDVVFTFVITDKEALQIIDKGFESVFQLPKREEK